MAGSTIAAKPDPQPGLVRELHEYWLSKRCGRAMPARGDIDPAEIKHLLPYILVADLFTDPVRVRYRLAGTEICNSFGFNVTGRWLHELEVTGSPKFWVAQYARMIASRVPAFGRTIGMCRGVELFRADWVLLPLSNDGSQPSHSLEIEDWVRRIPTARYDDETITWSVVALE